MAEDKKQSPVPEAHTTPEAPAPKTPGGPAVEEQATIPGMESGPAPSGKVIDLSDVLAACAGFGQKLLGIMQTIGVAFADFALGLNPADWLVGIVGAVGFRLLIYCKAKKAKKFRHDAEYGTARWSA